MKPNDRFLRFAKRGVVLIWALITMAVTTTIVGGLAAYYTSVGRIAKVYMDGTTARFSAQQGLDEQVSDPIQKIVAGMNGKTVAGEAVASGGAADSRTLKERVKDALKAAGFSKSKSGDGYSVSDGKTTLEVKNLDRLDVFNGATEAKSATIDVYSTMSAGGVPVRLKQTVTFELSFEEEDVSQLTSHPIFNYVYFANNRGQLKSKCIVANGDVGANDKFTIAGATINGRVTARRTVASWTDSDVVKLLDDGGQYPRMWPHGAYLENVAAEYLLDGTDFFTPVRPTDPYVAGGETMAWKGGYRSPAGEGGGGYLETIELEGNKQIRLFWAECPSQPWQHRNTDWQTYKSQISTWKSSAPRTASWRSSIPGTEDKKSNNQPKYYNTTSTRTSNWTYNNFKWSDYQSALNAWYQANQFPAGPNQQNYVGPYVNLQGATYTESVDGSSVQKPVVNISTNVLEMPNLSDDDLYRAFCSSNVVTVTNIDGSVVAQQTGGSLCCPNKSVKVEVTTSGGHWEMRGFLPVYVEDTVTVTNYPQIVCRHYYDDYVDKKKSSGYGSTTTSRESGKRSPMERTLASVNIVNGYKQGILPFEAASASDETVFGYRSLADIERGSVILVGTAEHPIEIKGPVYIDGDVIIRGFVSGQGAIYCGRNIHILGDLVYLNPPSWPHSTAGLAADSPTSVAQNNAKRDLLVLAARGNIVVGDYTQSEWMSDFNTWVRTAADESDTPVCNQINDSDIGYPANLSGFGHGYNGLEIGSRTYANKKVGFGRSSSKYPGSEGEEEVREGFTKYTYKYFPEVPKVVNNELHYYETRLGDAVISGLSQSGSASSDLSFWSSSWILRWIWRHIFSRRMRAYLRGRETQIDYSDISDSLSGDGDAGDITQIDAVLFANHGIFGRVGGSESKKFTLNGAMICRDEGLLSSFHNRESAAKIWLNWDMRIASDSAEGNPFVGATPDSANARKLLPRYNVHVSDWQQVPIDSR